MTLEDPYFVLTEEIPGTDFNRQLVEPGNKDFPEGAIGIYVDDSFWCVGALPWSYLDTPLEEVVREFWPTYAEEATYAPDHGSPEQAVYFARAEAASLKAMNEHLQKALRIATDDIERLKAGRTDMTRRNTTRLEITNGYFIRQYEHLLVAMAHEAEPRADLPGLCAICDLTISDRVHSPKWIARHENGYPHTAPIGPLYGDER